MPDYSKHTAADPSAKPSVEPSSAWLLFGLRNAVLVLLTFSATLHFKGNINLVFTGVMLACAMLLAGLMQTARLRLPACILLFVLCAGAARLISFSLFELAFSPGSISDADFLFFTFDRDFLPALLPGLLCWLFNILALRYPAFITLEAGLNALLMLAVFATEAGYNITLFHPSLFALILTVLILLEVAVLMVHWIGRRPEATSELAASSIPQPGSPNRPPADGNHQHKKRHRLAPVYSLLIIPLLLLFILNYLLMQKYNESSAKNRSGLMESTLFHFDFSKYIKLESEIKLSDDLVLLMRKNGPASRILIRRFVLSAYSPAQGFYQAPANTFTETPVIVPDAPLNLPDPSYTERETVEQEYFFINLDPSSLVALNYPVQIIPLKNWDASSFLRIYRVISRVAQEQHYSSVREVTPGLTAAQQKFYTNYAEDTLIRELAERITAGKISYAGKVLAIRDYLWQNFMYSLKPGLAGDGNQLHYFLFESHKGYCSYFAFAMALMCRSIGIPARVAVGFATLPEWEVLNFYEIRANQAHAWVEVYFGEQGWLEFDPTTDLIAPGEDLSFMNFQLREELTDLISEILGNQDKLVAEVPWEAETRPPLSRSLQQWLQQFNSFLARTWFFLFPLLYIAILLAYKLRSYLGFGIGRLHARTDRRQAQSLYRHAAVFLYNLGWCKNTNESLQEYARRLDTGLQLQLTALTESYLQAVFAEEFSAADYRQFIGRYAQFKAAYNRRVPLFLRLAAFLNPRFTLQYKDFIR